MALSNVFINPADETGMIQIPAAFVSGGCYSCAGSKVFGWFCENRTFLATVYRAIEAVCCR
jgi:hypothetical protein